MSENPLARTGNDADHAVAKQGPMAVEASRASAQVQASVLMAKQFPRDETAAYNAIMTACQRKGLAENAMYAYPRGNSTVKGPSIRLAEVLVRNWGNCDSGLVELERKARESVVQAYCWDMQTNTRETKIFTIPHFREVKHDGVLKKVRLESDRDIYEHIANMGARRKRACILAMIPLDVQEDAVDQCEKTMKSGSKELLIDRIRSMVLAFVDFGVNQEMIEKRVGHVVDTISETELVRLRQIYTSIKDNMGSRDSFFKQDAVKPEAGKTATETLAGKLAPQKPEPQPADSEKKSSIDLRNEAWDLLMEMASGDVEKATGMLAKATAWTPKTGKNEGVELPGKTDIGKVSDKAIPVVLRNLKKLHEDWQATQEPEPTGATEEQNDMYGDL